MTDLGALQAELPLAMPESAEMPIVVRRSARARRITLRILDSRGVVELVLPRRASLKAGLKFADEKRDWIRRGLDGLPPRIPFEDGMILPVLGEALVIRRSASAKGRVRAEDGALIVPARADDVSQRVRRWLVRSARAAIEERAREMATRLERPIARISMRDPATRWGSCTSAASLSFSWRLILAPLPVLDYVVAHEVAHLKALNHGPAFWQTVAQLVGEHKAARGWLSRNGARLRRYG